MRISLIILMLLTLSACSLNARHPGMDKVEYASFKTEIRKKAEACQASEQDLLPQSVKSIAYGHTARIIKIYLSIYDNPELPRVMQAESLYQIGLIYMNEFNEDRNDEQAFVYFNRLKTEYPESGLCAQVDKHMTVLESRTMNTQSYDKTQLGKLAADINERAINCAAEESALLPQSIEAISTKQAYRAIQAFLELSNDPTLSQSAREQALYQVGLIYMNSNNVHQDNRLALHYFKQLLVQFPKSTLCNDAKTHIAIIEHRINS